MTDNVTISRELLQKIYNLAQDAEAMLECNCMVSLGRGDDDSGCEGCEGDCTHAVAQQVQKALKNL